MSGRRETRRQKRYPRTARVNEILRQVVAEELERLSEVDERLRLLTVTAVESAPDLRHATVLLSSLGEEELHALDSHRARLQSCIGRQVRLKRTPLLSFVADPVVARAERIEEIIRHLSAGWPDQRDG